MSPAPDSAPARGLLDRIRPVLADRATLEVSMFGAVAVNKGGSLLVRVDPVEDARLLEHPHSSSAEMGTGRSTASGWIRVGAQGLGSDEELRGWLDRATRYLAARA